MSKLTPIILAAIMLASTSLVALDWAELEERKTTEADGRTGPDAKVTDIMSPRETTINSIDGTMQHTIDAGDSVEFEMYIENIGDADVTEMGISLTIYLEEGGERGLIAKDSNGNDLAWDNGDVVCDDAFVCPWSTIASNETLNYGRYTFAYQGTTVTWTPTTGNYIIVIATHALGDVDIGNDEMERRVSVVDWTDIIVDLEWDSNKEVETGAGQKDFTLSVSTAGSTAWSARNITLQLDVTGTIDSAKDIQGNSDLLGTTTQNQIGTYGTAETFRHEDDDNNVTNESRYVIDFEDSFEWYGYVIPDTAGGSGAYSVEVTLLSYVVYDQQPDCEETVLGNASGNATGGDLEDVTYIHFCEVEYYADSDAATSEDVIEGQIQTFHDIGITNMVINQGYELDENNIPITEATMPGMTEGPLNPVWSSVQANVNHLGSDELVLYDWEVEFEIENTITGQVTTETTNECMYNPGDDYTYMSLGVDDTGNVMAQQEGIACVLFEFVPGIYNISATVSMVNSSVIDQSGRNDGMSMNNVAALNNRPSVSLTVEQDENSIIVGPQSVLTLVADAYDADDEFGSTLRYVWTHPGMFSLNGSLQPSDCDGVGPEFAICDLVPVDSEWANVNTYSVTVYDLYGSNSMDFANVFIWNRAITGDTADSGITMMYDLTYNGINPFTLTLEDSETEYTKDLTEFGYAGEYSSVAVLDYTPVTTYQAEDVYNQSIMMTYDTSDIEPTSVFWRSSNGIWEQMTATITEAGTDGTIEFEYGENSQTLQGGEIILMGGELQFIETPTAHPVNLTVIASKGGMISASWAYSGNAVPGLDYLVMEICDSNDVCTTTQENTTLVADLLSGQTDTEHGLTYTYTLQVCNIGGCNPIIATDSATADKMVDGGVTATGMSVEPSGTDAWTVSWNVDGDASDVEGWMVCMADYSWSSAGEMPECIADAGDANSVVIAHPTGTGTKTYYFAAVPYDDKGNMENALPGTDTILTHANTIVDPCVEDPSSAECAAIGDSGDSADSGEVPTWTWGVIIGLVVVAFVVGAFILSRGGDGDDGKDWDY